MTSKLKCPFCQKELKHEKTTGIYCCSTIFIDCPLGLGTGAFGTKELWQALIENHKSLVLSEQSADREIHRLRDLLSQSQRDLQIAVGTLRSIGARNNRVSNLALQKMAHNALAQINHDNIKE